MSRLVSQGRIAPLVGLLLGLSAALACSGQRPSVATYGPPPRVTEPSPDSDAELQLIVGDALTPQEQEDLVAIHATRYQPPRGPVAPLSLDADLDAMLSQEGSALINEKVGYDIPIVLNDRVEWWISYFADRVPSSFERYLIRGGAWLPYLQQRLREAGLPEDMAYLALIESGFSTRAVSHAGAVGPWQFMPYTGREYGLRIDRWVDERRDYERSTDAAIAYLSDLHRMFASWYLAAAGYNGGQGRVGRAMVNDNTVNFWELTGLHDETKNYVPKLIAATIIAKEPSKYGFGGIDPLDPVEWATVTVPTSTDLEVIAQAADVPLDEITMLNPHLLRGRTPPGESNFPVKIPADRVEAFNDNYYEMPPQERVRAPLEHLVRRGETVAEIAEAYGVESSELMRENGLRNTRALRSGQTLTIPGRTGISPTLAPAADVALGREHRVAPGETLSAISRQYGVTVAALKAANNLRSDSIRPGQRLTIP
ncbi:MAG: LysM peptidoglycan-binding domain-containing protein [Gemmatimonadota bacterium]